MKSLSELVGGGYQMLIRRVQSRIVLISLECKYIVIHETSYMFNIVF